MNRTGEVRDYIKNLKQFSFLERVNITQGGNQLPSIEAGRITRQSKQLSPNLLPSMTEFSNIKMKRGFRRGLNMSQDLSGQLHNPLPGGSSPNRLQRLANQSNLESQLFRSIQHHELQAAAISLAQTNMIPFNQLNQDLLMKSIEEPVSVRFETFHVGKTKHN